MKKLIIFLFVLSGCVPAVVFAQQQFSFKDGKFKIAQFTDLHWTPRSLACTETEATICAVLKAEHPDIAILSGDVVTEDPAIDGWKSVIRIFDEAKVPFALLWETTMRNTWQRTISMISSGVSLLWREAKGTEGIMGCGNCVIPVYGYEKQRESRSIAVLYGF